MSFLSAILTSEKTIINNIIKCVNQKIFSFKENKCAQICSTLDFKILNIIQEFDIYIKIEQENTLKCFIKESDFFKIKYSNLLSKNKNRVYFSELNIDELLIFVEFYLYSEKTYKIFRKDIMLNLL